MILSRTMTGAAVALCIAAPAAAQQQPFGGLSPEGRARLAGAMSAEPSPGYSAKVAQARSRVLDLLGADDLDIDEIAEAQQQERELVMKEHARAHARMRDAYEDLSASDRKAFAQALKLREQRLRAQMAQAKDRMEAIDRLMRYQAQRVAEIQQQQRARARAARQVSEQQ
ncbi:hypothetical protein B5C34_04670 [Pacificimonas flava]|uniref:Periplasmic heavy metal sensor n=2 Tax=Pacificimonas TaxID=1960290 RepID=A0A219B3Q1_9SPHN|nr:MULTISPECIES: hypothetical protein [Pacificimonas]MBZ6377489.1 hypothetical protein [Pacificimonas aurantium]OWV32814.1 hypothetical protein B5C34_04670 [Pacificimonas flava]